jgi:hypothetical protein
MKTAMSLALARIEMLYGMKPDAIHWEMFKNDCMEKEKEQIIDAVEFGLFNIHTTIDGKYYYDLKYKLEI